ncbi:hypothetical protein HYC85_017041 [Camellia sinensis]|uniref:RNA helicase n=1 Tax=Camellia sinensis TaxID=4442 RepID=A0A7J7H1D5_CAMSI|nr:hypothetical protein HYC85_017041 [Camellia sinensis]
MAFSSSILGVSSIYQTRTTTTPPLSLPFSATHFRPKQLSGCACGGGGGGGLSFVVSAVATPNSSVLSEEAFKGLGGFDEDSLEDYESETEPSTSSGAGSEDELVVSKLGLPRRLVESLHNRGITSLFPIQSKPNPKPRVEVDIWVEVEDEGRISGSKSKTRRAVLVPALEGRDIIARAKTGTGKTLAFGIPIIKQLSEDDQERSIQRLVTKMKSWQRELSCLLYQPTSTSKRTILSDLIMVYAKGGKAIVFTQTKRDADEVSMTLTSSIPSEALHGDISQHQRERTLNGFRQGKFTVLVATDVAARGLDIPNVDLIIHYELPNDPETFVHRSGRTGRAGKEGTAILMFTSSQRRTIRSLERDVGCKFEFISPPSVEEVLESSAEQVVATLSGVHPESVEFFTPTAQKLIEEQGTGALAAAIAQLSGFSQPPSSRSLITHEKGLVTLQLTRDPSYTRGFLSARSVTGFLSDVYSAAADVVGKIHLIADERVQGAVFDLPEEIAKVLLNRQIPPGNTISKITKVEFKLWSLFIVIALALQHTLPTLQDDGPPSDNYGRFSNRDRGSRGGSKERGAFRNSLGRSRDRGRGWGRGSDDDMDEFDYRRGGRGNRSNSSWSPSSRDGGSDWLIGGRRSGRSSSPSFGNRDRSFGGACFNCGRSGHRASECPNKLGF